MKIEKYLGWSIIYLLCMNMITRAQDNAFPNIIPPSPNAASLGVYGDIPVSKYTGVPDISIPIYNVKTRFLNLPITLNYHASGIKVAQEASWVGLGWSLSAGGVIARSVRGLDDFSSLTGVRGFYQYSTLPPCTPDNDWEDPTDYNSMYISLMFGMTDPEPDLFYYNFGGFSGKMIYSPAKNDFVSVSANDLQIHYINSSQHWQIRTSDGTKYIFRTKEVCTNYVVNENSEFDDQGGTANFHTSSYINQREPTTITGWYLDSIISPFNDFIAFTYDSITHQIASQISRSQVSYKINDFWVAGYGGTAPPGSLDQSPVLSGSYDYYSASQQVNDDVYLKRIKTNEGLNIVFNSSDRLDMEALDQNLPQKLSQIVISSDSSSHPAKTYSFSYSYINDEVPYYKNRRLRLDSIGVSAGAVAIPPYSFAYYDFIPFPPKDSKSIDHWGYFNWADNDVNMNWGSGGNNGTLIPSYQVPGTFTTYTGANRTPDARTAPINTLTRINYPTGGYTKFDFELNDYNTTNTIVPQYHEYKVTASYISGDTINRVEQYVSFSLSKQTRVTLASNAYSPDHAKTCVGSNVVIDYTGMDGTNYAVLTRTDATPAYPVQTLVYNNWDIMCPYPTDESSQTIVLPAGSYQLETFTTTGFRTEARVFYTDSVTVGGYNQTVPGGGLRVRSVISGDGQHEITKSYRYTQAAGDSTISSGILLSPLVYFYDQSAMDQEYNLGPGYSWFKTYEGIYICGQSSTIVPLGTTASGNPIGYSKVTEMIDSSGAQGKTVYSFINIPDQYYYPIFPNVPSKMNSSNGLISNVSYYSANALLKSVSSRYFIDSIRGGTVKGLVMYNLPFGSSLNIPLDSLPALVKFYDNPIEWYRKVSDSTTEYSDSGSMFSLDFYHYDSTNCLVNGHYYYSSDGKTIVDSTSFAQNYPTETQTTSTVFDAMKASNMISLPLKEERTVNGMKVSGKITNYGSNLAPSSSESLDRYNYAVRQAIDAYDVNGNVLQYHKIGLFNTSVLWGYNNSKPVVIAKNISKDSLQIGISQVLTAIGYAGLSQWDVFLHNLGDLTSSNQKTLLKSFIASAQINQYLSKSLFTILTYDLLDGTTSSTDEHGFTTYYEYDPMGRLQVIRDKDSNIVKTFEYNYKK